MNRVIIADGRETTLDNITGKQQKKVEKNLTKLIRKNKEDGLFKHKYSIEH